MSDLPTYECPNCGGTNGYHSGMDPCPPDPSWVPLVRALGEFRHARDYAAKADTDADWAQRHVVEAQGDLLDAIAELLLRQERRPAGAQR